MAFVLLALIFHSSDCRSARRRRAGSWDHGYSGTGASQRPQPYRAWKNLYNGSQHIRGVIEHRFESRDVVQRVEVRHKVPRSCRCLKYELQVEISESRELSFPTRVPHSGCRSRRQYANEQRLLQQGCRSPKHAYHGSRSCRSLGPWSAWQSGSCVSRACRPKVTACKVRGGLLWKVLPASVLREASSTVSPEELCTVLQLRLPRTRYPRLYAMVTEVVDASILCVEAATAKFASQYDLYHGVHGKASTVALPLLPLRLSLQVYFSRFYLS